MADHKGLLWVLDGSRLSHLAISEKGGYLEELYRRRSVRFPRVDDALASIDEDGLPDVILVGAVMRSEISRLLSDPRLKDVRVLMSGTTWNSAGNLHTTTDVYTSTDDMTFLQAVMKFANSVVNAPTPRWPPESDS